MIETCRDVYPFLARHVDAGDIIETCCTPEMYVIPFQRHVDPDTVMSIPSFQMYRRCADMIETCRDVYPFLARHVDAGDTIETCCTPEMYVIPFQTYRSGYDDRDLQR